MTTPLASSPAVQPYDTDSVYAAFFSAVGSKPNESYEKLLTLLPSAKPDPRQQAASSAPAAALDPLLAPPPAIHPLTKEWLDAASALDEDVPLEEGDWLDVNVAQEAEVLDEEGIPVVSGISRSSSCCILDAPGAVQVDNFTEDGGGDQAGMNALPAAYVPSVLERQAQPRGTPQKPRLLLAPEAAAAAAASRCAAAGAHAAAVGSSSRGSGSGAAAAAVEEAQKPAHGRGAASQAGGGGDGDGGGAGAVVTLEDEIKRLGMGRRAAAAPAAAPALAAQARGRQEQGSSDEDEGEGCVEVVHPGLARGPGGFEHGGLDLLPAPLCGVLDPDSEAAAAVDGPPAPAPEGVVASLPGECLATDSGVQAQLMDVNDQDMLEHMGLGKREDADDDSDAELDVVLGSAGQAVDGDETKAVAGPLSLAAGGGDAAPSKAEQGDGPSVSYADVEGFRLDPDFDYDNVKLTPRGFPYNVLRPARQAPFSSRRFPTTSSEGAV